MAGDILKQLESNNRQGTVSKKTPEITPAAAGGHATQFFPARRSRSESDKRRNHKYRHQQSDTDGGLGTNSTISGKLSPENKYLIKMNITDFEIMAPVGLL